MRYIVFTIILAVSGCKQGNHREWLPNETPTLVQVFKIDANRDTTLVGTNGTILKVQAKSFQTISGEEAQGEIELRIQEFYAKHEFVRNL